MAYNETEANQRHVTNYVSSRKCSAATAAHPLPRRWIRLDSNEGIPAADKLLPGSQPLRNYRHELFAQARAVFIRSLEATRKAGYETITPGDAAKIDRNRQVRARIRFLQRRKLELGAERIVEEIAERNRKGFHAFTRRGHQALADALEVADKALKNDESVERANTLFPLRAMLDLRKPSCFFQLTT
jgi:hypothetical protein